jgi:CRISPR/Cas system-associated endonuclease Cas1
MPFRNAKTLKIEMSDYGSYLGRAEGCFEVRNKNGEVERYPHFEKEIGEAVLKSGSYVSVDALIDLALWNVDTYIMTRRNRVVAVLKNLEDDSHVKTRIAQYEVISNGKGISIAKQIIKTKIESENMVLRKYGKYGLRPLDTFAYSQNIKALEGDLKSVRARLMSCEGRASEQYFKQVFLLFYEPLRPSGRKT